MGNLIDKYLDFSELQDYSKTYKFLCDAIESDPDMQLAGFELVGLMLFNTDFFSVPPDCHLKLIEMKKLYDKKLFNHGN